MIFLALSGLMIAFLWVQTTMPGIPLGDPWDVQIDLFFSIFSVWLPAIYLFFAIIWGIVAQQQTCPEFQKFLRWDILQL